MTSVKKRVYGQYCGFARALEAVGERWGLLIVRDLLVSPRRFTDLLNGLPGIPSNVLTTRLKELEETGVVRRRALPRPERAVVYELTEYGMELEPIVFALGRWGAKSLGEPRPDEVVTAPSLVSALRTTFCPEEARGVHVSYELQAGDIVVHGVVDDGKLVTSEGPLPNADLVIEAGPGMKAVMAHEISAEEALANGIVRIKGDPQLLELFAELFRIGDAEAAASA